MKILLLGSGGREHALAWKMAQSPECKELFIGPGNGGTRSCGVNVDLSPVDFSSIAGFVRDKQIDLVVVGPEEPLVKGIHDFFLADSALKKVPVIGPVQKAARIEGSKDFSKAFMKHNKIPTAAYRSFSAGEYAEGCGFLECLHSPYVLKADGLAAGKGVVILDDYHEACKELESMLNGKFGAASQTVVIEEYLKGIELSVFIITDGTNYCILPEAKDYKRIGEGDTGPNTGGMGSISGVPFADGDFMKKVESRIIAPTVHGLTAQGIRYSGFIFFGLMNVNGDPYVIEYNARLGDPETESVLPRVKNDLVGIFDSLAAGKLQEVQIEPDERFVASVMMVSGGYPGAYPKGKIITGLEETGNSMVFHAGTTYDENEKKYYSAGGRVIAVSSFGKTIPEALAGSYHTISRIRFDGAYFRNDIGYDL